MNFGNTWKTSFGPILIQKSPEHDQKIRFGHFLNQLESISRAKNYKVFSSGSRAKQTNIQTYVKYFIRRSLNGSKTPFALESHIQSAWNTTPNVQYTYAETEERISDRKRSEKLWELKIK